MVAEYLGARIPGAEFETVEIKTSGDRRQDWSLEKFGGKGLFTKEIEDALLSGAADIAVHSAKDLPTECPGGLEVAGCLPRDECADTLVMRSGVQVPALIASGSPRRRAQLKKMFPQSVWTEFRGNVHTRLKKLAGGAADASVLSQAGLLRLGIESFEGVEFRVLKLDLCVPAVGQGIIALQCRSADVPALRPLTHGRTQTRPSLSKGSFCRRSAAAARARMQRISTETFSGYSTKNADSGRSSFRKIPDWRKGFRRLESLPPDWRAGPPAPRIDALCRPARSQKKLEVFRF